MIDDNRAAVIAGAAAAAAADRDRHLRVRAAVAGAEQHRAREAGAAIAAAAADALRLNTERLFACCRHMADIGHIDRAAGAACAAFTADRDGDLCRLHFRIGRCRAEVQRDGQAAVAATAADALRLDANRVGAGGLDDAAAVDVGFAAIAGACTIAADGNAAGGATGA